MKNVKLNLLLIFSLIFCLSYQGYADCPRFVESNTQLEATGSKAGKGFWKIINFDWSNIDFDEKLLQYIRAAPVNNQETNSYFDPKIKVCDYEWGNCHELPSGTSCHKIYGTQATGAGVSAAVFIDWEGDKTKAGGEIAQGLGWEWAEYVSDEEKIKFANAPKICACSQKGACMSGISSWGTRVFSGENIFRPGNMENVCDTCYQTKIQCVPVPLAPGPPPFCEQLGMSPPQVRIVPITDKDNDYFDPKVKVIAGDLIKEDGKKLDFPREYRKKDRAKERPTSGEVKKHSILDKDGTTHYFETYREKDKLCTEYYGTEREESQRKLQFPARCFPAPPAPEPEEVNIVDENTLEVKMKMSEKNCKKQVKRSYSDGYCTFEVSFNASKSRKKIDPRSFRVVKPRIVKKTTKSNDDESNISVIIEGILRKNPQFEILEKYGLTPNIGIEFPDDKDYSITNSTEDNEIKSTEWELDDMGQPKIEVKYMRVKDQKNSKSKMLCLSGWKPEPEEYVLKRGSEVISLKSMGTRYIKYNAVYSKESNQFYYLPSKEGEEQKEIYVNILIKPQEKLDHVIFNKQGYVFFSDENKQEKGKCSYCVNKDSEINEAFQSGEGLKVVYKLIDGKHKEKCEQGDDGCLCFNGVCSRSTQYVDKDDKPFYLRYEEVDCEDKDSKILTNKKGEIQKCTQLKDQLIKTNRTEVFYTDRLCRFDLEGLKNRLRKIIVAQLEDKKWKLEESDQKLYELGDGYTDDLSVYDYVEIEAWGGGEAGHIDGKAHSTVSRPGMPGDYIKAQLKIDPNRPIMIVEVKNGGGNRELYASDKNGGSPTIKICDLQKQNCQKLITVAGGGTTDRTKIHKQDLKLKEAITKGRKFIEDNKIAYIKNGEIEYKGVTKCSKNYVNKTYGAGGCINESSKSYSKGAPGYVKIKPMLDEINEEKVNKIDDAIDKMIQNPDDITGIDDSLINKIDQKIIDTIKEEIKKELLGL